MRLVTSSLRCALLATLLVACTTEPPKTSRLDSSGLTVVTLPDSIVLARPVRTLAAGARDYAYVGPVEINRMGKREYYFWIGLASTVDRDLVGLDPDDAIALALIVDGEPMILSLSEWDTRLDTPPYIPTAPVYAVLAAQTSLDQIQHVAAAESVELHVIAASDSVAHYRPWHGSWATWTAFPEEE